MDIRFEDDATVDCETGSLVFFCTADGEPVRCVITQDALLYGLLVPPDELSLPETFAKHRTRIHEIATRLLHDHQSADKAGILISQLDVARNPYPRISE